MSPHRLVLTALCTTATALSCWGIAVFAPGAAFAEELPDGRVAEMVTPPMNHEADLFVPFAMSQNIFNAGLGGADTELPFQVDPGGGAVAYVGASTTGGTGQVGSGFGNEYVATRGNTGGWTQVGIQPAGRKTAFYNAFSGDISLGFLNAGATNSGAISEPPLSPDAPAGGYPVLYTHATQEGEGGTYTPLFTQPPAGGEPPTEFYTYHVPHNYLPAGEEQVAFAGTSADLKESFFEVHGVLAAGASDAPEANNLYVSDGGRVVLVNVLPDGSPEPNATFGGPPPSTGNPEDPPDFGGVVSGDGSKIFWTDLNTAVTPEDPSGGSRLFVRENPTAPESQLGSQGECLVSTAACTVQVDASHGPGPSGGGRYWYATPDGSLVFFTDESQLTGDSTAAAGAPDLYEYEVATGNLKDLTVDSSPGEPAGVQGLLGASEDGSYVYLVAHGVLAANKNSQGTQAAYGADNLYVLHAGEPPRYITTLTGTDDSGAVHPQAGTGSFGDWQPGLGHRTAEVTPDGQNLVFESDDQSVNGYSPELGGEKLEEVYLYSAEGDHLFCVSCSPSHAPAPSNREIKQARVGAFLPPSWSLTYLPTWVSGDGSEVFFDSAESLVGADTNGIQDVYEWEREGTGGCTLVEGCLSLLSAGTSPSASWLVGVSAGGGDAFVISRAQLTPEDGNEAYNLFDLRVGGVRPPTPLACTGTGCQGVPAPAPTFATPPSGTYEGVGNFAPSPVSTSTSKPKPKSRSSSSAQKLARALRTCRKKPKGLRVACENKARRTYGRGK